MIKSGDRDDDADRDRLEDHADARRQFDVAVARVGDDRDEREHPDAHIDSVVRWIPNAPRKLTRNSGNESATATPVHR
jgi:hypothetical protein